VKYETKRIIMSLLKISLLSLNLFMLTIAPAYSQTNSIVVGYYRSWFRNDYPAEQINLANLTHINHAFAWPEADGSISMDDNFRYPKLIDQTHQAGKKILVALGGWGQSDGFSPMAANASTRANFIKNITDFCLNYGYDGVDINLEFPASVTDRNNLTFNEKDSTLLITMVVPAGSWNGQWFDFSTMKNYVNWFGCMTYDFHGEWSNHAGHNSPLYAPSNDHCGSVHDGIQYINVTRNIPIEKIVLGIPFYGRGFNANGLYAPHTGSTEHSYSDIVPLIGNGWMYVWDNISKVPYLMNLSFTKLISFDDSVSVRLKCEYAREKNLAGVMIWALGHDMIGYNQPLLTTVGKAMGLSTQAPTIPIEIPSTFVLLNNYPNPFNENTNIPYYVAREEMIKLEVFDIAGKHISILVNEQKPVGWYTARFVAGDLPSGEYYYRLSATNFSEAGKMLLTK
jgi:chitinase